MKCLYLCVLCLLCGEFQARTTFESVDNPAAVQALEALRAEVSHIPERVTQRDQTPQFLESIANDTQPLALIEVPLHTSS